MKKIADITKFETLGGTNIKSDLSVFNLYIPEDIIDNSHRLVQISKDAVQSAEDGEIAYRRGDIATSEESYGVANECISQIYELVRNIVDSAMKASVDAENIDFTGYEYAKELVDVLREDPENYVKTGALLKSRNWKFGVEALFDEIQNRISVNLTGVDRKTVDW